MTNIRPSAAPDARFSVGGEDAFAREMEAFDRLPYRIREAMRRTVEVVSAIQVEQFIEEYGEMTVLEILARGIR